MLTITISSMLRMGVRAIGLWSRHLVRKRSAGWFYMTTLVLMQHYQYSHVYAHLDFNNLIKLMDGLVLDFALTIFKLLSLWGLIAGKKTQRSISSPHNSVRFPRPNQILVAFPGNRSVCRIFADILTAMSDDLNDRFARV